MDFRDALLIAAGLLAGGAYLIIGVRNVPKHAMITGLLRANGILLPGVGAAIGIAMQIGFGALMISGFYPVVAASGLAAFTVLATLIAHRFWAFKQPEQDTHVTAFLGNSIMTGGLLGLAAAHL